jgi:pimeloyl-ACP methyl ester carboxylesterase
MMVAALGAGCSDDAERGDAGAATETGEGDGDGDPSTGDGDPSTGDGDPSTGDGDPSTGDGDPSTGDGDPSTGDGDPGTGDGDPGDLGKPYDQPGPYAVTTSTGQMQANAQCNLSYAIYEPATLASEVEVLLAHGFMRSIADMAATAEHLASWGVRVYAVPLCTNNFSINHQLNGQAMAALGEALAPGGAVYSGFSAGGLAAFVATATASNAVAYVGLDSVDNDGLGLSLAGQVGVPARGSLAEPGQCNTNNNFLPIYDALPAAPAMRIVGASHFDFETDACGFGDFGCNFCAPTSAANRALALGMTTAAILLETGADPGGLSWWQPGGAYFDMYAQQGRIVLIP